MKRWICIFGLILIASMCVACGSEPENNEVVSKVHDCYLVKFPDEGSIEEIITPKGSIESIWVDGVGSAYAYEVNNSGWIIFDDELDVFIYYPSNTVNSYDSSSSNVVKVLKRYKNQAEEFELSNWEWLNKERKTVDAGDENSTVENSEQINRSTATKQYVLLSDGSHFSEGIAWVKYQTEIGEEIGLLNADGEVITSTDLSSLDVFGSAFSGGYAYVNMYSYTEDLSRFLVFDRTGTAVVRSPDDGSSYKIIAGGDGMFLVQQEIRSMTVNESRFGVIKANGTWLIDLEKEMSLIKGLAEEGYVYDADVNSRKREAYQLKTYYLGEQMFIAYVNTGWEVKVSLLDASNSFNSHWTDSEYLELIKYDECTPYEFFNGKNLRWTDSGYNDDVLCVYDKQGNTIFSMPMNKKRRVYYNEGIFFMGYSGYENESVIYEGAFYDMDGNVMIDLSDYTFVSSYVQNGFYEFHDGKAAVKILGADKEYYISHIDLDGNFLYEPVKINHTSNMIGHGGCYGNAMYITDQQSGDQILRTDGTTIAMPNNIKIWDQWSTKDESEFHFSDGFAWCKNNNVFIDENGEYLNTYIIS